MHRQVGGVAPRCCSLTLPGRVRRGATSYRVYRKLNSETEFSEVGEVQFTAFSDKLLDDTMFAAYYVTALNEFGESGPSETLRLEPIYRDTPRTRR